MCGICGIASLDPKEGNIKNLAKMSSELMHRGPDMEGEWKSDSESVLLAHRRLSIHDLTSNGHQPMQTHSCKGVIAFNGEIYNFKKLRRELETKNGKTFRSTSDTEVLCEYIDSFGIESTLHIIEGMYAFVYYDLDINTLYLCRDRAGEKPLYYWLSDDGAEIYFSSELRSLLSGLPKKLDVDETAMFEYFSLSYVPAPKTIMKGAKKLSPATYATINLSHDSLVVDLKKYWSLPEKTVDIGYEEAKFQLDTLIQDSIKDQLEADVPVGAFLSGGIDSSTVVSIAQSIASDPVKTFTIGFKDRQYNEANDAKLVADYLSTQHHEVYLSSLDVLENIPSMIRTFDEPCGDVSLIPTQLLACFTKGEVTVSLSGDGGDELFWGYDRYKIAMSYYSKFKNIRFVTGGIDNILGARHLGQKLKKGIGVAGSDSLHSLYLRKSSHWLFSDTKTQYDINCPDTMAKSDFHTYLPDQVLFKVDRAAMSCSLEGRIPFLNPKIIEFAFTLPFNLKLNRGTQKYLLKEVLADYIPREIINRPKKGFNLPLSTWLRVELADWARGIILNSKLQPYDVIPHSKVCNMLEDHILGKYDYTYLLWDYIVMSLWLDEYS